MMIMIMDDSYRRSMLLRNGENQNHLRPLPDNGAMKAGSEEHTVRTINDLEVVDSNLKSFIDSSEMTILMRGIQVSLWSVIYGPAAVVQ
jgi:hypothetical protein